MTPSLTQAFARASRHVVLVASLGVFAVAGVTAQSQSTGTQGLDPVADKAVVQAGAADADELTDGEVRKVDREAGRLTLRHGPLRNLDMPGMTMVFDVADAAMLDRLRPGEKVRFQAGKVDGRFVVVRIEPASSPAP